MGEMGGAVVLGNVAGSEHECLVVAPTSAQPLGTHVAQRWPERVVRCIAKRKNLQWDTELDSSLLVRQPSSFYYLQQLLLQQQLLLLRHNNNNYYY